MWQVEEKWALDVMDMFCEMSLASVSFRKAVVDGEEMAGLSLHDLHLEFCQEQAKSKQVGCVWHTALLQGFCASPSDALCFDPLAGLQVRS